MWQIVGGDWGEIDFKRNGPGCDLAVCGDGFNWITQPSRGVWRCHTCRQNTGDVLSTANCSDSTVWSHMTVGCYASVTIFAFSDFTIQKISPHAFEGTAPTFCIFQISQFRRYPHASGGTLPLFAFFRFCNSKDIPMHLEEARNNVHFFASF